MKSYLIIVFMQPGQDEGNLLGVLSDAGAMPELLTQMPNSYIVGIPGYIKLRVHIRNENQAATLVSRLQTLGLGIQSIQLESD